MKRYAPRRFAAAIALALLAPAAALYGCKSQSEAMAEIRANPTPVLRAAMASSRAADAALRARTASLRAARAVIRAGDRMAPGVPLDEAKRAAGRASKEADKAARYSDDAGHAAFMAKLETPYPGGSSIMNEYYADAAERHAADAVLAANAAERHADKADSYTPMPFADAPAERDRPAVAIADPPFHADDEGERPDVAPAPAF